MKGCFRAPAGWSANKKLATYSDQFRFARPPFGFRVR